VRNLLTTVDIVLLDLTTKSQDVLAAIGDLNSAIGICHVRPRLLCFSTVPRSPQFVLGAEKHGARYTRVANILMLVEAIELLVAEMTELERNGPSFQIVHRYSQGTCAPGEEVSGASFLIMANFVNFNSPSLSGWCLIFWHRAGGLL
jgi:hypothetical protein